MKVILQRVTKASVTIDGAVRGSIDKGYVVLLGVGESDTEAQADKLVDKISKLRIFEDENGKTNLSAADVGGEILVISQFTLYADCKKGNRPSFIGAGSPQHANELYEYFVKQCEGKFAKIQCGEFGADMKVELVNDGPFTIYIDSDIWEK